MKASSDLFDLIKSLSKTEKRYFRLYSSLQKGDKAYIKMFEFIDKMKVYDEAALKIKFKKEKFSKHLPFTKRYLYNSIIKSLLAYNNESSIEQTLLEQLIKVKLLYNRSLFRQASAAREKAKMLALKHERDYIYYELVRSEIQTLKRTRFGIDIKDDVFKEEQSAFEKIQSMHNYSKLYLSLADLRLIHGFIRAENSHEVIDDILKKLPELNENSTIRERYQHISTYVRIFSLTADMESMLSASKEVLELMEKNPSSFEDGNSHELHQAYLDIFHPCIKLRRFKEYEYYTARFRALKPKTPADEINIFIITCISEISKFLLSAEFKAGIKFIDYVEKGFIKYGDKIHKDDEAVLIYNISRLYIGVSDFEKALEYSNRLLSRTPAEVRPDIYCYAKIINLVIHYELGNDELVSYLIRSVYKLLKRREKLYRFESLLLSLLRKLPDIVSNEDFKANLVLFRNEMILQLKDPFEKNAFIYFDFISWAESKIRGKSFEEVSKINAAV